MIKESETPTFIAERMGPFSYSYRPRNEAALRICRLAKRTSLDDVEMKLIDLLGLKYNCQKGTENGSLSEVRTW